MQLVRYQSEDKQTVVGVRSGDAITPIPGIRTVAELLRLPVAELKAIVESAVSDGSLAMRVDDVRLLPPLDGRAEVWCAGVTYERSRGARVEESTEYSIYDRVYVADRPELFPKSPAWRLVTDGEPIGIRTDSGHDVPEPELAVVVNRYGQIAGYTVCNDVSSRSIEGENPLYLPQAKVYVGGCALAAGIRPVWQVTDPLDLTIRMTVRREGGSAFEATTSTASLVRPLPDLVAALFAANDFPDGAVLATGTGIVPEMQFALLPGDVVEIEIDQVGVLTNHVVRGKEPFGWLSDDRMERPQLQEAR
ncbi:MAG: fumarylacetoacetate hydrolase family protein [Nocardioidaceae bacterium]